VHPGYSRTAKINGNPIRFQVGEGGGNPLSAAGLRLEGHASSFKREEFAKIAACLMILQKCMEYTSGKLRRRVGCQKQAAGTAGNYFF
jgi:hypothetical protein